MRGLLRSLIIGCCLLLVSAAPLAGQDKDNKKPDVAAPEKFERDNSNMLVYYLLAAIAIMIIMALICMPVRRD